MNTTKRSSPHTRGARGIGVFGGVPAGIIPAYAGSTNLIKVFINALRDHPRIRGEHSHRLHGRLLHGGSSPHTRGARFWMRRRDAICGIIPAYVGSTENSPRLKTATGDHPRIRGEHPSRSTGALNVTGSSPHTRGAPPMMGERGAFAGIVPAYAGSTGCRSCR